MKNILLPLVVFFTALQLGNATIWHVGPSKTYKKPSQIKDLVQDGDFIYIEAGVYINDAVIWRKKNLKFQGEGNEMNPTILRYNGDIPNGKGIWVFDTPGICDSAYIASIVFDGAQVSDQDGGNGAGIRFQANDLFVVSCTFMNCQNGILEGHNSVTNSNVTIMNCEFYNNGYQMPNDPNYSGYGHNMYISASVDTLYVTGCWMHHPRGQANALKTRAQRSYIIYNLIDEEAGGYGSWEVNIAQGGLNIILGNVIIQGATGANHGIIGYDAVTNDLEDFYFVNNTIINQYPGNIKYFNIAPASGINTFFIYNNLFASVPGANNTFLTGNIPAVLDSSHNLFALDYLTLGFTDPLEDDYSLTSASTSVINRGVDAGEANTGFNLYPVAMPRTISNAFATARLNLDGMIDIGAYEYYPSTAVEKTQLMQYVSVYPNPSKGRFNFVIRNRPVSEKYTLSVFDIRGKEVHAAVHLTPEIYQEIDLTGSPMGIYFAKIHDSHESAVVKVSVF